MKDREDLTGKRFGKLTALSIAEPITTYNGRKRNAWNCICDCGNECVVRGDYLRRGQKTHCNRCKPLPDIPAHSKICRSCKYSEWNGERYDWDCQKNMSLIGGECDGFWCNATDKVTGAEHRESKCIMCGKPVYSKERDVSIYCEDHRYQFAKDSEIIQNAPMELLFGLIAGIFERARDDYLYSEDENKRDAEEFFRSLWAQELTMSEFDVDKYLKRLDDAIDELERDRKDNAE